MSRSKFCFTMLLAGCIAWPTSLLAASKPFIIGGPEAIPTVCPAPVGDVLARQELADLERGAPTVADRFYGTDYRALLHLRIAMAELDDALLSQSIENLRDEKDTDRGGSLTYYWVSMRLMQLRNNLPGYIAARRDFTRAVETNPDFRMPGSLISRLALVDALLVEARALGGERGRSLLDEALKQAQEALTLARPGGSPKDVRLSERHVSSVEMAIGVSDRDATALSKVIDRNRAALDTQLPLLERLKQLDQLVDSLHAYAELARGVGGLQALEEARGYIDQAIVLVQASRTRATSVPPGAIRGLENAAGRWSVRIAGTDTPCYQLATLEISRAESLILAQWLRSDEGQAEPVVLKEAIAMLQRAQTALSLQPDFVRPASTGLLLGRAYRLLAASDPVQQDRPRWLGRAKEELDANARRIETCFCAWVAEKIGQERDRLAAAPSSLWSPSSR